MLVSLLICYLIFLGIYCYLEKQDNFRYATIFKVLLSLFVAIVSWYGYFNIEGVSSLYILIPIGLSFAVPADYFLQYIKKSENLYRAGIISFGLMHISLLTAFFLLFGFHILEVIICAGFLIYLALIQKFQHWNDLGGVKLELSIYTVLVTLMGAKAISIFILNPTNATFFLALGGFFFFVSDFFLGEWGYRKEKYLYLFLNRSIYFIGQLALAFYILFI